MLTNHGIITLLSPLGRPTKNGMVGMYMLQCKCETGGFANTLNSWWIRENSGANAKPFYLKSYGWLII